MCVALCAHLVKVREPPAFQYLFWQILAVSRMLINQTFQSMFDLLAVLCGYIAIRHAEGYALQQVLCYGTFCFVSFIWSVVILIIAFVNPPQPFTSAWIFYLYYGSIMASPIIYFLSSILSFYLYKELKATYNETILNNSGPGAPVPGSSVAPARGGARPAAFGGMSNIRTGSNYDQVPNDSRQQSSKQNSTTGAGSSAFKAFAGQGRRLGE